MGSARWVAEALVAALDALGGCLNYQRRVVLDLIQSLPEDLKSVQRLQRIADRFDRLASELEKLVDEMTELAESASVEIEERERGQRECQAPAEEEEGGGEA